MDRTTRLKIYAAAVAAIFITLGLTLWLPGIVLWQTGELWPAESVVSQQRKHEGLWSSGLLQSEEEYKQSLFDQSPADITAIGSSRILQLRKHMFAEPFVNMGRGLEMLRVDEELPELIKNKKPKLVLWGFDYWHFGTSRAQEQLGYKLRQRKTLGVAASGKVTPDIFPRQIHSTWGLLAKDDNKLDWAKAAIGAQLFPGYRIGLRAVLTNRGGYASDGSHYSFGVYERPDTTFRELQDALRSSDNIYQLKANETISADQVDRMRAIAADLKRQNIHVVVYLVPLPSRSIELMRRPEFANYVAETKKALAQIASETGIEYFDYLDGASGGIADREFMDSIHPGEPAVARLLLAMSAKSARLRNALNMPVLEQMVRDNAGKPAARQEFYSRFGVTALE
jgi:hypothetical protein